MDSGGTSGLRRLKEIFDYPTNFGTPEPHKNLQHYILATRIVVSMAIVIERGSQTLFVRSSI
jgi:hypothetical protein